MYKTFHPPYLKMNESFLQTILSPLVYHIFTKKSSKPIAFFDKLWYNIIVGAEL